MHGCVRFFSLVLLFTSLLHAEKLIDPLSLLQKNYQSYDERKHAEKDHLSMLIGLEIQDHLTKNEIDAAKNLLDKTVLVDEKTKEIGHWYLAKIAIAQKHYRDFRKHLQNVTTLPLLKNTKQVAMLYESLPTTERSWLVDRLVENSFFLQETKSNCPYFELDKRQDRGQFLYRIAKNQHVNKKNHMAILQELYVTLPEVIPEEQLKKLTGFTSFYKNLTNVAIVLRMENLMIFGKNNEARQSFLTAKDRFLEAGEDVMCPLLYADAKVDRKMRKYDLASKRFKSLMENCSSRDIKTKAGFMYLKLLASTGDVGALADFDTFVKKYPDHSFADDVLMFKAKLLLDNGLNTDAVTCLTTLITQYPHGDMIMSAKFLKAFVLAKSGAIVEAMKELEEQKKISKEDSLDFAQAQYWLIRLQLYPRLNEFTNVDTATLAKLRAPLRQLAYAEHPTVYSWLALALLAHVGEEVKYPRKTPLKQSPHTSAALSSSTIGQIFNIANRGFREEALDLLDDFVVNETTDSQIIGSMGIIYNALNSTSRGHQKLIRCNAFAATSLQQVQPQIYYKISYPQPFNDVVLSASQKMGISKHILWSIMRQESGFIPQSRSWAQARGLMQLMYESALEQAKKIGIQNLAEDDLYDPKTNVVLGSSLLQRYWKNLGHVIAGLAAYNAGPSKARSWQNKNPHAIDAYFEEISFAETREYIRHVVQGILMYAILDQGKEGESTFAQLIKTFNTRR